MKYILAILLTCNMLQAETMFDIMARQHENKDYGVQVVPSRQWCEHAWCINYISYLEMGSYSCMDTNKLKELIKLWEKQYY